jgi:restriction system protein
MNERREEMLENLQNRYIKDGYDVEINPYGLNSTLILSSDAGITAIKVISYDKKWAMEQEKKSAKDKFPKKLLVSHNDIAKFISEVTEHYSDVDNIKYLYIVKDSVFAPNGYMFIKNSQTVSFEYYSGKGKTKAPEDKATQKQLSGASSNGGYSSGSKGLKQSFSSGAKKVVIASALTKTPVSLKVVYAFLQHAGYLTEDYDVSYKGKNLGFSIGHRGDKSSYLEVPAKFKMLGYDAWILGNTKQDEKAKKSAGDDYEIYIGKHYESLGYIVKYHGLEKGKDDGSIDLIAINPQEVILIQCKNWSLSWCKKENRYLSNKDFASFDGYCEEFIKKNPQYKEFMSIKKIFIMSNETVYKNAEDFALYKDDYDIEIIPFIK